MFFNSALKARIADLELQLKSKDVTNERLFEKMGKYVAKVSDLEKQLEAKREVETFTVKRMVGLKFKALFNGLYQPTEFKTGPGPCGKIVTHFTTSRTERELTIHQHHTDGSQKDFEYRLSDIDGRIQYDYEQVKVYGEEAERERALRQLVVRPRFA